jgi:hypothetical protein
LITYCLYIYLDNWQLNNYYKIGQNNTKKLFKPTQFLSVILAKHVTTLHIGTVVEKNKSTLKLVNAHCPLLNILKIEHNNILVGA